MSKDRVLLLSVGETDSYLTENLKALGYDLSIVPVPGSNKFGLIAKVMALKSNFKDFDAVVTTEYARAFAISLRKRLFGGSYSTGVIGLNQSGAIIKSGLGFVDRRINSTVASLDFAIVHSQSERELWQGIHKMDAETLPFAHWGYDLPHIKARSFSEKTEPYFCMIGRNNRDFETFSSAVTEVGANGVIITSRHTKLNFEPAANIEIKFDLPLDHCLDCIRGAAANVILVNDQNRGAGHITAVSGMHLSKPQIFTAAETLAEYLIDDFNGLAVPFSDVKSTADAMRRLLEDEVLAKRLGKSGQSYAAKWMTTGAAAREHAKIIDQSIHQRPFAAAPEDWLAGDWS